MRHHVTIIEAYCKRCGVCQYVCPKQVFDFQEGSYPVAARMGSCVGCGQCEMKCPDFAILVEGEA